MAYSLNDVNNLLCGWSLHLIYGPIFFNGSLMGISHALSIYRRKFREFDKVIPPSLNITHNFRSSGKNVFCFARFLFVPVLLLAHVAWFPRFRKSVMMIVSSNFFVSEKTLWVIFHQILLVRFCTRFCTHYFFFFSWLIHTNIIFKIL